MAQLAQALLKGEEGLRSHDFKLKLDLADHHGECSVAGCGIVLRLLLRARVITGSAIAGEQQARITDMLVFKVVGARRLLRPKMLTVSVVWLFEPSSHNDCVVIGRLSLHVCLALNHLFLWS